MAKKKSAGKKKTSAKRPAAFASNAQPDTTIPPKPPQMRLTRPEATQIAESYPGRTFGSQAFRSVPPCTDPTIIAPVFTKDGRFVITPGPNLTVAVWNYPQGTLDRSLAGRATRYDKSTTLNGLALSPDETKIAASGFGPDGITVRILSFEDGSEVSTFDTFCDLLVWLPNSEHLLCTDTRSSTPEIKIFHAPSATMTGKVQLPVDWSMVGVALESADALVAFYRNPRKTDAKLAKYRISNGEISQKPTVSINVPSGGWHEAAFSFAPATGKAAIAQGGAPVFIYDIASKQVDAVLPHTAISDGVSFDPTGSQLALKEKIRRSEDGNRWQERIVVHSMPTGKDSVIMPDVFRGRMAMSWAPDREGLATWSTQGLEIWHIASGAAAYTSGHRGHVTSLLPNGPKAFASAGVDGTIRTWSVDNSQEQWVRYWPEAAHRGVDLRVIADESVFVGWGYGPSESFVRISRCDDGQEVRTIRGDGVYVDRVNQVVWVSTNMPNGKSGWTRELLPYTFALEPAAGTQPKSFDDIMSRLAFDKNDGWAPRVSLERDGRWLVVHNDKQIVVAEWPTLTEVYRDRPKAGISMAAVAPRAKILLIADKGGGVVSVVDADKNAVTAIAERHTHGSFQVGDVLAVSPDSKLFAWVKRFQRVEVFDIETGRLVGATPKWLPVTSACFLDASTVLVSGRDGTISEWTMSDLNGAINHSESTDCPEVAP
jgi:WD40 repeat protein